MYKLHGSYVSDRKRKVLSLRGIVIQAKYECSFSLGVGFMNRIKKFISFFALSFCLLAVTHADVEPKDAEWVKEFEKPMTNGNIEKVHFALYEAFVPDSIKGLKEHSKDLLDNYHFSLSEINRVNEIKLAYRLLSTLEITLGALGSRAYYTLFKQQDGTPSYSELRKASKGLKKFLKSSENKNFIFTSIANLNVSERRELLQLLENSTLAWHRRLAMSLKAFYSSMIYRGEIGGRLAQLPLAAATPVVKVIEEADDFKFETNLAVDKKKNKILGDIDYLIVGSGVAGSILAHELYLAGKSVVVMEKGPFTHPTKFNARNMNQYLRNGGVITNSVGDTILAMAEVAGGGSIVNYDIAFPVSHPSVLNHFREWRELGLVSSKTFSQEKLLAANDYVTKKIGVRTVAEDEINNNNNKLMIGANALGRTSSLVKLTTLSPEEMKLPENEGRMTNKRSGMEVFLMPAMKDYKNNNKPVSLLVNVAARKIIFEDKKAVGIEFVKNKSKYDPLPMSSNDLYAMSLEENKTYEIRAKNIILAAGSVGTTYLLKNSKVKNENIGRGFVVHPVIPMVARFDTVQDHYIGTQSSVYVGDQLRTEPNDKKLDYVIETSIYPANKVAMAVPGTEEDTLNYVKSYRKLTGAGVILIDKPNNKNQINFKRNKDDAHILFSLSKDDKTRFKKAIGQTARLLLASGAKEVIMGTTERYISPETRSIIRNESDVVSLEKNLQLDPATTLMLSGHIMATNKMGSSAENSVVDHDFRVWNTQGLYITDASIFPTSVGANPMMSIYTTAYIFAHSLLDKEVK